MGDTTTASNPEERIEAANAEIEEANRAYAAANENANTANEATNTVDDINSALNTGTTTTDGSRRVKRQSETTTVSPIADCDDFGATYNQLLDELKDLSDDNID